MDYFPEIIGGNDEIVSSDEETTPSNIIKEEDIFDQPIVIKEVKEPKKNPPKQIKEEPKVELVIDEVLREELKRDALSEPSVTVKKTRKKRGPMSEEHKAKLALSRVKALKARKEKAAIKKEIAELTKLKKEQDLDELRESVKKKKDKKTAVVPELHVDGGDGSAKRNNISKEQVEEISMNAIMNYDRIRKERKKDKLKLKKIEDDKEAERQELMRLTNRAKPALSKNNYWDNCY